MSKRRPAPHFEHGDYSFYDASFSITENNEKGTDLKRLLANITFSSDNDAGLEFVDILSNAVRRTLTKKLQRTGWENIKRTMIHRNEPYIQFVMFGEGGDQIRSASYGKIVIDGFSSGGRSMLTPSNNKLIDAEEEGDNDSNH